MREYNILSLVLFSLVIFLLWLPFLLWLRGANASRRARALSRDTAFSRYNMEGIKCARREDISPETVAAYETAVETGGSMSNKQMAEMLRACGWKARVDENGKLVVDQNTPGG